MSVILLKRIRLHARALRRGYVYASASKLVLASYRANPKMDSLHSPQYPTYFPTCEDERVQSAVTYISTSYFIMSRTGNPDNLNYWLECQYFTLKGTGHPRFHRYLLTFMSFYTCHFLPPFEYVFLVHILKGYVVLDPHWLWFYGQKHSSFHRRKSHEKNK